MLGNGHVPFLGGGMMVTSSCYPTAVLSAGSAIWHLSCSCWPCWRSSVQRSDSLLQQVGLTTLPRFPFPWPCLKSAVSLVGCSFLFLAVLQLCSPGNWWRRCQQGSASASHAKRRLNSS